MEKLAILGFKPNIYDDNINSIIGNKGVGTFYQLLKKAQYIANF